MYLRNIHKILFITLSNIGDCVLTLPVLSALKEGFPTAEIDVVVGPRPRDVFLKDRRVNRIFSYDKHTSLKNKTDFLRELRARRYDLAVDMRGSLIPYLIGAKRKIGLFSKERAKHKKEVHLSKIKCIGITYLPKKNIYLDEEDRDRINTLLEKEGVRDTDILVGISPGSNSPIKQWRKEGFIEVISKLILQAQNLKIVLVGDEKEAALCSEIANSIGDKRVIDFSGRISLNELFALIEEFDLLLTNDSANLHIASDLGVKVVSIFGPTDPQEYGPTSEPSVVIRKKLACSPCKKALCLFNHECMTKISSEEVLEAVTSLL